MSRYVCCLWPEHTEIHLELMRKNLEKRAVWGPGAGEDVEVEHNKFLGI